MVVVLLVGLSYLIGSIPFGLFTARVVRGVDIRTLGSGNIGATNVGREIGWTWGGCVLFLDALKGLLPTLLPVWLTDFDATTLSNAMVACGIATCVGHMFPIYLGFKGGKGVATGLGVAAAVAPWSTLIAFATFIVVLLLMQRVSLASIVAATAFSVAQVVRLKTTLFALEALPLTLFTFGIPLLIVVRHRTNIVRLLNGTEPKTFGKKNPGEDLLGESASVPQDESASITE